MVLILNLPTEMLNACQELPRMKSCSTKLASLTMILALAVLVQYSYSELERVWCWGVSLGVIISQLQLFQTTELLKTDCALVLIKPQLKWSFFNGPGLICSCLVLTRHLITPLELLRDLTTCTYYHLR